jgi:hypothetical protein
MFTRNRLFLAVGSAVVIALSAPTLAFASATTTTISPATSPAKTQVIVSAFSEKGDYIANGVSAVYSTHWSKVSATTSGIALSNIQGVSFSFTPVAGQSFAVGSYDNVQRAAYRSAGFAGIEITGPGRPTGCIRLSGSFHIWDIATSATGSITRLDLTYVEHCGAGPASNYGEVLINDAPQLGALVASATRIAFPDQTPTLPYVLMNSSPQAQSVSIWQSATTVSHFTITPVKASCAVAIPARSSCTYLVRLLPPKPGNYTANVLAVSGGATLRLALSGPAGGV